MKLIASLTREEVNMAMGRYIGLAIYDGSYDPEVVIQEIGPDAGAEIIVIVGDFAKGGDTDAE